MSTADKLILNPPKAFLTDVFGTVVNWRKTVVDYLQSKARDTLNSASASIPGSVRLVIDNVSWPEFAQKWRSSYYYFVVNYDPGTMEFKTIDEHHIESLYKLIDEYQLKGLWTDEEIVEISLIWHKLEPWPDSPIGLEKLSKKFITATLSNGGQKLLKDLCAFGGLTYTQIISAEDFKAYKPNPRVYLEAAKALPNVDPTECCLIAAHLGDLKAAKGCGYKTVYIEREMEESYSLEEIEQAKKDGFVDMWISLNEDGVKAAMSTVKAKRAGQVSRKRLHIASKHAARKVKEAGQKLSNVLPDHYVNQKPSALDVLTKENTKLNAGVRPKSRQSSSGLSSIWSQVKRRSSSVWSDIVRRGTFTTATSLSTARSSVASVTQDVPAKPTNTTETAMPHTDSPEISTGRRIQFSRPSPGDTRTRYSTRVPVDHPRLPSPTMSKASTVSLREL